MPRVHTSHFTGGGVNVSGEPQVSVGLSVRMTSLHAHVSGLADKEKLVGLRERIDRRSRVSGEMLSYSF